MSRCVPAPRRASRRHGLVLGRRAVTACTATTAGPAARCYAAQAAPSASATRWCAVASVAPALPLERACEGPARPAVGRCELHQARQRRLGATQLRGGEVRPGEQFQRALVGRLRLDDGLEDARRLGGLPHGRGTGRRGGTPSAGRAGSCPDQRPATPPHLPDAPGAGNAENPPGLGAGRAHPPTSPPRGVLVGGRPAGADARRVRRPLAPVPRVPGGVRLQLRRADDGVRHLRLRAARLAARRRRALRPRGPAAGAHRRLRARGRGHGAVPGGRRRRVAARRPGRAGPGDRRPHQHPRRRRSSTCSATTGPSPRSSTAPPRAWGCRSAPSARGCWCSSSPRRPTGCSASSPSSSCSPPSAPGCCRRAHRACPARSRRSARGCTSRRCTAGRSSSRCRAWSRPGRSAVSTRRWGRRWWRTSSASTTTSSADC